MRKVIYGGACSLDGYVAGKDGALDWLHFSKDVQEVMAKSWASTDTILMGRKTWEGAAGVPAFLDPGSRVNMELTECRQLDGGCVLVTYRVK